MAYTTHKTGLPSWTGMSVNSKPSSLSPGSSFLASSNREALSSLATAMMPQRTPWLANLPVKIFRVLSPNFFSMKVDPNSATSVTTTELPLLEIFLKYTAMIFRFWRYAGEYPTAFFSWGAVY